MYSNICTNTLFKPKNLSMSNNPVKEKVEVTAWLKWKEVIVKATGADIPHNRDEI